MNPLSAYSELQRAIPGLAAMYQLVSALINQVAGSDSRVLIVGAGGGRELAALGRDLLEFDITAVDPSKQYLQFAEQVARDFCSHKHVTFFNGVVDDLPLVPCFDIATSLLVMHHMPDDGAKLDYLVSIRRRLCNHSVFVLADVSAETPEELDELIPVYRSHAELTSVAEETVQLELDAIAQLPIISGTRTHVLLSQAGFGAPRELFRSLWYRCWVSHVSDAVASEMLP